MNQNSNIKFIGIGAQKAGTTWMYSRLNELPDFSMPARKEIHYFDRSPKYNSPDILERTHLITRPFQKRWIKRAFGSVLLSLFARNLKKTKWYIKYFFQSYDDNWYMSLFNDLDGISGDISPSYSLINIDDIKRMYKLVPEAKIIFILRDPIDRAWSHYRFNHTKNKVDPNNPDHIESIKNFINSEGQELRSNYIRTIENYSSIYPKEQILICFFDELKENPTKLLTGIVNFVGGNSKNIELYCSLQKKTLVSRKLNCPPQIFDFLKLKYHDQIKELADAYGGYPKIWYNQYY